MFTTTYSGDLYAFNAATGAILLKTPLSAGTNAPGHHRRRLRHRRQAASPQSAGQRMLIIAYRLGATGKLPGHRGLVADRREEADMGEPAIAVRGLRKSFGAKEAVAGIDLEIAARFPRRAGRAERGGEDHVPVDDDRPAAAGRRPGSDQRAGCVGRPGRRQGGHRGGAGRGPAVRAAQRRGTAGVRRAGCAACRPAEARSRAAQLLDVLDLTADAKRLVADYSTGMRKKAALGCALIHNPAVLFLDEPLEGVDPVSADVIRRLLTRFVGSGSTVLFSSHVMELVEQVCDHVSIIDKGQIVATGTTDQVRGGKTLQQAFIDLVGAQGRRTRRDCHGSAPRPAEAAPADATRCARPPGPRSPSSSARSSPVLVAVGTFALLALLRGQSAAVDLTTVVFTVFAFGWLILPLFAFGLDGTLDPATLALYPLRTRPLAVGPAGRLGHRRLAAGQRDRPARGDRRAGPRRVRRARRAWSRWCCRCCSASRWPGS